MARMLVPQQEFLNEGSAEDLADSIMGQYTMDYLLGQIDWEASPRRMPPWEAKESLEAQTIGEILEELSLPTE